jgi:hypothetical protein
MEDALALLREQKPVIDHVLKSLPNLVYCPNCGAAVEVMP